MSFQRLEYSGTAVLLRCHGWCEEEQTQLQLSKANISLAPIPGLGESRIQMARVRDYLRFDALQPTPNARAKQQHCYP